LLAMFFALIGNPVIRLLKKLFIPRFISGALVLCVGLAGAILLIDQLAEPAVAWIQQAPTQLHQLEPKMRTLLRPVQEASSAAQSIAQAASTGSSKPVRVIKTDSSDPWDAFLATPRWVAMSWRALRFYCSFLCSPARFSLIGSNPNAWKSSKRSRWRWCRGGSNRRCLQRSAADGAKSSDPAGKRGNLLLLAHADVRASQSTP